MKGNFDRCLAETLRHEGGFADHPKDPGGATMRGVTQRTYDAWRSSAGLAKRPVREIEDAELHAIYREGYWDAIRGDDLPAGVDLAVFDYAVNSGPGRASKELQRVVLATMDGLIGPVTLAAVQARKPSEIVRSLCAGRLAFLKSLSTWETFGRGWERRVVDVQAVALAMTVQPAPPTPAPLPPQRQPAATEPSWLARLIAFIVALFGRKAA
jgi:lysozyme family protein